MRRAGLLPAQRIGPAMIAGFGGGWAVLWFAAEPPGQPAVAYLGQFFGAVLDQRDPRIVALGQFARKLRRNFQ
jgi:hypothetical protein